MQYVEVFRSTKMFVFQNGSWRSIGKVSSDQQLPLKLLNDWLYHSFTAHQYQTGHTVPKQSSQLDDDDAITESTRNKNGSTAWELHCLRTALCESIRYQAKSEQNFRQNLIPRMHHGEAALCTPNKLLNEENLMMNSSKPLTKHTACISAAVSGSAAESGAALSWILHSAD